MVAKLAEAWFEKSFGFLFRWAELLFNQVLKWADEDLNESQLLKEGRIHWISNSTALFVTTRSLAK